MKTEITLAEYEQIERRQKLLCDIVGEGTFFEGQPLELPAGPILELFNDISLRTWCHAVGVVHHLNTEPDAAWRCPVTIVFQAITRSHITEENDDDL